MSTIFKKIIDRHIPADIFFEDELCLCFKDIHPRAPTHLLLIPKKEIPTLQDLQPEDAHIMGHMLTLIPMLAKKAEISEKGYRLIVNCKEYGGQEVYHLHFHILGGKPLSVFA